MTPASGQKTSQRGVALVTTVIVVAVLAVVAVAFMQTTTLDRLSARSMANHYQARLAAEAGLADAMARMGQAITSFNYVSGSEPAAGSYRTYLRPTAVAAGVWNYAGPAVYLDSGTGGNQANLLVSGSSTNAGVAVRATWVEMDRSTRHTNRYAFWTDEAGAKQNLSWWSGDGSPRGFVTNVANLPLLLPSVNGETAAPLPSAALAALRTNRTLSAVVISNFSGLTITSLVVSNNLVSPASLNLVDSSLQGRASRYFFALSSPSGAASPAGRRKLNLAQLARYLNSGISSAQGSNSPKAVLVEELLKTNSTQQANWGGGDLSWFTNSGVYTNAEPKQIVANLIDYLDSDMIPTTDSTNSPTYFGVEIKTDSSGRTRGHPMINFVCAGFIINRSTTGEVNSTRILSSISMVYPWDSTNAPLADYTPEIAIRMDGTVINPVPGLANGSTATPYFNTNDLQWTNSRPPNLTFIPRSGQNWPFPTGFAATTNYQHGNSPLEGFYGYTTTPRSWPARGPTNLTFQNAKFVFTKLRLRFRDTDGQIGYVQILPTNLAIEVVPATVVAGGSSAPLIAKFSSGGPYAATRNLYLNSDPRAHFRSNSWTNLASATSFGSNIPAPASGVSAIVITNGAGANWDGSQGMTTDFSWYRSSAVTNHFSRATNTNGLQSIGELGYLWSGRPWQTLNMTRTNNPAQADWNILDYVSGGYTNGTTNLTTMPLLPVAATGDLVTISNSLMQDGGFNVLTRKPATIAAFLTNAPDLVASAAGAFAGLPPPESPSVGGALAGMVALSSNSTNKFGQEAVVRALANAAVTQSRIFTIYSMGEYMSGAGRSRVLLEADVFVDINAQTGAPLVRVLNKSFR